jgi:glycosyltransferase involved in cell wall biosynthesis
LDVTVAQLGRAGPHVYVTQLAQALAPRLGKRLHCIASRLAAPLGARRTAGDRVRTVVRDLWWHQIGVTLAARHAGADLLHLPTSLGPARPAMPTVVTIHDLIALRFPEYFPAWQRLYAAAVLPRLARNARAVIAVSTATKQDIVERLGVAEQQVTVVPNGIEPAFTALVPGSDQAHEVRSRLRLPRDFVLTVGTLEPRKNLPRVLEALHRLRSRPATAGVHLVHAGPAGWLADDVARTVHALHLSDAVHFLGFVPAADLAALYSLARICVYPSLYEGFGLPVVEAMACGCPVITSNVSSLPEVAGDAAVLVDPASADEITEAIASLWCDEPRRGALRARGLQRAGGFTWERTARETAAVYDAALS